jgi:hypothetical protein
MKKTAPLHPFALNFYQEWLIISHHRMLFFIGALI